MPDPRPSIGSPSALRAVRCGAINQWVYYGGYKKEALIFLWNSEVTNGFSLTDDIVSKEKSSKETLSNIWSFVRENVRKMNPQTIALVSISSFLLNLTFYLDGSKLYCTEPSLSIFFDSLSRILVCC